MPFKEVLLTVLQGMTETIKLEQGINYKNTLDLDVVKSNQIRQTEIMNATSDNLGVMDSKLKEELSLVKTLKEELSLVKTSLNEELSLVKTLSKELGSINSMVSEEYKLVKQLVPKAIQSEIQRISYTFDNESDNQVTNFTLKYDNSISNPCFYHSMSPVSIQLDDLDRNSGTYTGTITNYTQSGIMKVLVLDNINKPYLIKHPSNLNLEPTVVYHFPISVYQYINSPGLPSLPSLPSLLIYKDDVVVNNQFDVSLTIPNSMKYYDCNITTSVASGGDYTLALKFGDIESDKINFSVQSVFIESPSYKQYNYRNTMEFIVKNIHDSTYTCKLKKINSPTYETLTFTQDLITGTIISTKTFSSTDVGEYEFLVSTKSGDSMHHFTVDPPYNKNYEKLEKIDIHYNTTFINNTTNEVITKVAGDTFIPLTAGNYSWTLSNVELNGTFIVNNLIQPLGWFEKPRLEGGNIWHITAYNTDWASSTDTPCFVIDFTADETDRSGSTLWNPTFGTTDSNFSNRNRANATHTIMLSNQYFQDTIKAKFTSNPPDFNYSFYVNIKSISIKYKFWGLYHWRTVEDTTLDAETLIDIRN